MNSRARTRTRQTLLVLGETLDTRYAANFKAWRKPVDDVICANATRNTQPNTTYAIFRRADDFPARKLREKTGGNAISAIQRAPWRERRGEGKCM